MIIKIMERFAVEKVYLLNLDDTIDKFLDNPIIKLDNLHIYQRIAYGRQITVEHKNISVCMSLNQMITHGKRDKFLQQAIKLVM